MISVRLLELDGCSNALLMFYTCDHCIVFLGLYALIILYLVSSQVVE